MEIKVRNKHTKKEGTYKGQPYLVWVHWDNPGEDPPTSLQLMEELQVLTPKKKQNGQIQEVSKEQSRKDSGTQKGKTKKIQ